MLVPNNHGLTQLTYVRIWYTHIIVPNQHCVYLTNVYVSLNRQMLVHNIHGIHPTIFIANLAHTYASS